MEFKFVSDASVNVLTITTRLTLTPRERERPIEATMAIMTVEKAGNTRKVREKPIHCMSMASIVATSAKRIKDHSPSQSILFYIRIIQKIWPSIFQSALEQVVHGEITKNLHIHSNLKLF